MHDTLKIAILISGRGSNMQSLVQAATKYNIDIVLVASDRDAAGILWAEKHGLETHIFKSKEFRNGRAGQELALADALIAAKADYIFLAGYMAILSANFVETFPHKIINIHPSLLPKYKGLDTHQRALNAKDSVHGATVHLVTAALDDGPILLQGEVPIYADDDADTLANRTLSIEHIIYPEILSALSTGNLRIIAGQPEWNKKAQKTLAEQFPNLSIGN